MKFDVYCDESRPDLFCSKKPLANFVVIGSLIQMLDKKTANFITAYLADSGSTIEKIRMGPQWKRA